MSAFGGREIVLFEGALGGGGKYVSLISGGVGVSHGRGGATGGATAFFFCVLPLLLNFQTPSEEHGFLAYHEVAQILRNVT